MANPDRMFQLLMAQAQRGDPRACVQVGRRIAAQRDYPRALMWFSRGAKSGFADALAEVGFLHTRKLVEPADPAFGVDQLRQAAAAGHADAGVQLAKLMLEGRWLALDRAQLCTWIERAVEARVPELRHLGALFDSVDAVEVHRELRQWLETPAPAATVLRVQPLLAYVDAVLPPAACRWLCAFAKPQLRPALVYEPKSGQRVIDHTRSNSAAHLEIDLLNTRLIEWRLLASADPQAQLARSEPVSVLHYAVGQEYQAHRDYLNPTSQPDQFPPNGPGQRTRTVFAYLNDVAGGGQTHFPTLGHSISPRQGRVVMFDNLDADGRPDPTTLHASLPVTEGEKWLATLWLREGWVR